ncbi:LamG-like jellyroll fold domain-containing protein [uncultured Winogradskyella sp.]|uniref:LamG-like jellyroll fold domain-containing protein n=1 Tax=uncultured Winogradskyella sp. TaxID=395353 RepID=UPI0030DC1292|tara:strand:- start:5455 stop:9708 length:4254 start_codon:yes stop_codon:yes gene_type:complete
MSKKLLFVLALILSLTIKAQTNASSIQTGVTFQWSTSQTNQNQPANIKSVTVNNNVYFNFGVPTGYELTQLGPTGHGINRIRLNGGSTETTSAVATWNSSALDAFQSLNLNHYFEANGNGANICNDFTAEQTTNAQRQTLSYAGGIIASSSGIIAITERNANNCYHIEFFGIPVGGGLEQSLGETFVNQTTTQYGFGGTGTSSNLGTPGAINPPNVGTDYWLSDRVIENKGTIGIALFFLNDIAPTGSVITKARLTAGSSDHGDGKLFILTLPDQDKDGLSDVDDLDDENDGVTDKLESNGIDPSADHDIDGTPNYLDPDFCTLNALGVCANLDFDSDGIPNHFDVDSDNDGITDVIESGGQDIDKDGDADGLIGKTATTLGIPNTAGTGTIPTNTDNSGSYNHLDLDSDNDGIPDNIEAQPTIGYAAPSGMGSTITDANKDGVDDTYGTAITLVDTDNDGIYDYVDLDSDNDGTPDIEENGMANSVSGNDTDSDGLDTNFEGSNVSDSTDVNDEINNPTTSILPDTEGDLFSGGDLDYRDLFNVNPPPSATLDFDGIDDYLSGNSIINGRGQITIMAWVKIDANNQVISNTTIAGEGISCRLYVQNGNELMFGIRTTSGSTNVVNGININYNEWHHVAGTFTNTTGELRMYVDGKLQSMATLPTLIGETFLGTSEWNGDFEVGRLSRNVGNKEYFTGDIDEIRVFNSAITDEQVQQLVYQEIENNSGFVKGKIIPKQIKDTKTLQKVSWANLLAYYPMTDIKNSTTSDYSENNNTLKLMNISTVQEQTAPMPYQTNANGDWSSQGTWLHGDVWDIEDAISNKDWSIVNIKNNVTSYNSHTNLGLFINTNKKLTIMGDNKVENTWYLELNGALDLKDDSQLIQGINSDLVTSTTGKILRRQEGTSSVYWYNYWASPVGSIGATTLLDTNTSSNNTNNSNFNLGMLKEPSGSNFQFTSSYHEIGKISTYWLYTYINGITYYDYAILNPNTALQPGVGYTQKGTGASGTEQQYLFEGKPNNGTILINVIDTGGNGSIPAVSKTDYLLGNPYASAIDLHKFIDDNSGVIDGVIHLWQQWSGLSHVLDEYNGGYAQVNKTGSIRAYQFVGIEGATNGNQDGTKKPSKYLPVGQGFMTEIVANGTIVFKNSQRVFIKETDADGNYNNGSVFFRNATSSQNQETTEDSTSEEGLMQKMRIEFTSVDGPSTRRELLLGFSEDTSDDYDYGYDAKNVEEYNDDLNLVFDDELMTIQAYSEIAEDKVVPLTLKTSGSYNYTIALTEIENISEDQEIYLKDNLADSYYNLRSEQPYEFSSEAGEFANRFEIVFQEQSESLSLIDQAIDDLNIYYAFKRNKIVVLNPNNKKIKSIEVYNVLGQSVYRNNAIYQSTYNEFEVHNLSTGTYIIKLMTDDNAMISKKIIVK